MALQFPSHIYNLLSKTALDFIISHKLQESAYEKQTGRRIDGIFLNTWIRRENGDFRVGAA